MRGPQRERVCVARRLRSASTDAEMKVWLAVRDRRLADFKFVRQEPIGPYIVDFICRETKLIIEVDGGQHNESANDRRRDAYLNSEGYRLLRFWNNDILTNMDGVLQTILSSLNASRG
jgi:very-short-patch-repair endonuclease